jgi:hypothetical protein
MNFSNPECYFSQEEQAQWMRQDVRRRRGYLNWIFLRLQNGISAYWESHENRKNYTKTLFLIGQIKLFNVDNVILSNKTLSFFPYHC